MHTPDPVIGTLGSQTLSSVPQGHKLFPQCPGVKNSFLSTPGSPTLSSVLQGHKLFSDNPGSQTLSSVPQVHKTLSSVPQCHKLCHHYRRVTKSVISTPGSQTLSSVPHDQKLLPRYPMGPRKSCLLGRGFYVSPMWRVRYQRLLWLAHSA